MHTDVEAHHGQTREVCRIHLASITRGRAEIAQRRARKYAFDSSATFSTSVTPKTAKDESPFHI